MGWYWYALIIGWPVSGFLALILNIRDNPRMQENVGLAETWPVVLGPLWLCVKLWQLPTRHLG